MNEGVQGLFSGIGNAMAETGRQGTKDYFQKSRLKMRQRLNAEAAQEDREFQKEQSKTEHERSLERLRTRAELNEEGQQENWEDVTDEQGNVIGQRNTETNKFQPLKRSDAKLDPRVKYQLDRVSNEIDHLWEMEKRIRTGSTGEMQGLANLLGADNVEVTDDNRDDVLADIHNRIEANERQMNQLLGNTRPTDPLKTIIDKADEVPEGDREEFLNDLSSDPRVPDDVVQQVRTKFGATQQPEQQSNKDQPQSQQSSGGQDSGQQQERQQEQPQSNPQQGGGFLQQFLQGQGNEQSETRVPFRSGANQGQSGQNEGQSQGEPQTESTEQSGGVQDNRLGPAIERGISSIMSWPDRLEKAQKQRSISNMEEIARKGGTESKQEKNQFLGRDVKYINELSPELQNRLIEIFGEETLKPYLNQE